MIGVSCCLCVVGGCRFVPPFVFFCSMIVVVVIILSDVVVVVGGCLLSFGSPLLFLVVVNEYAVVDDV